MQPCNVIQYFKLPVFFSNWPLVPWVNLEESKPCKITVANAQHYTIAIFPCLWICTVCFFTQVSANLLHILCVFSSICNMFLMSFFNISLHLCAKSTEIKLIVTLKHISLAPAFHCVIS